jgi:hypothetical protein
MVRPTADQAEQPQDGTPARQADRHYPPLTHVEVRYPLTEAQKNGDRALWPWLQGEIAEQCGDDEWLVTVWSADLATVDHDGEWWYPQCFRDASEIRLPQ